MFSFQVQYVLLLIFYPVLVSRGFFCGAFVHLCAHKADLGAVMGFSFKIYVLKAAEDELFVCGAWGKQQFCRRH